MTEYVFEDDLDVLEAERGLAEFAWMHRSELRKLAKGKDGWLERILLRMASEYHGGRRDKRGGNRRVR